ncbi:RNA polymerase sigma factor region1.1 domain-containing protein [Methylorubrum salsuginis]|uniref:Sigma-70 factor, region 1.1 n=1 Tax=Methylorubrum salsuginis TaxID=414703 RepID=A0A1I4CJT7_9HYPH|nr:RNA polymerase sigma factor region1.1 domain-containing protein [Methylorubrum salsuginis]SFK80890.1 Sigma-70 factor, region 1.1 [Methylorubrum salsuginis]
MTTPIDRATLDRLVALGRERGELTADDLQRLLPIDAMDVDALVLVMLELDAAGVSVEPDAFGPRGERPVTAVPDLPAPERGAAASAPVPVGAPEAGGGAGRAGAGAPAASNEPAGAGSVDRIVLVAGLAAFVVLAGVLLLV